MGRNSGSYNTETFFHVTLFSLAEDRPTQVLLMAGCSRRHLEPGMLPEERRESITPDSTCVNYPLARALPPATIPVELIISTPAMHPASLSAASSCGGEGLLLHTQVGTAGKTLNQNRENVP